MISILPSLSALIRSFASMTRMFEGWVSGWLLASLRSNSAARAGPTRTNGAARAPAAAPSISERRVRFMLSSSLDMVHLVSPGQRKKVEKCGTAAMIRSPAISAAI